MRLRFFIFFFGKCSSLCEDAEMFDVENLSKNVKLSINIYDLDFRGSTRILTALRVKTSNEDIQR